MNRTLDLDQAVVIPWFFAGVGAMLVVLVLLMLGERSQFALFRFSRGLDAVVVFAGKAAAWLFLPLILIILLDVVTRRAEGEVWSWGVWIQDALLWVKRGMEEGADLTSTKLQEMEWHLHTVIFALGFGFAYIANAHVRVDLVRERLKPRAQQWIELLGALLFMIPYCGLLFFIFAEYAANSFDQGEVSSALTGLSHRWIIKAVLPLGLVVAALSAIAVLIRKLLVLFAGPELVVRVERFEQRVLVQSSDGD
ncbi:MAG: TRAP transporter small permease subunit [Alphaproteobacteria bacterium]